MKRFYFMFFMVIVLFGCSNKTDEPTVEPAIAGNPALEEQIESIMSVNGLNEKEVIDYDIKDNFIYVIFKQKPSNTIQYPDLVILKEVQGQLEWVAGPNDRTMSMSLKEADAMIFGRDDGPSVTILLPQSNTIKEIKVLGTSAKEVAYVEHYSEDFSKQYMYWIAFTEEEPTKVEDFKFIFKK